MGRGAGQGQGWAVGQVRVEARPPPSPARSPGRAPQGEPPRGQSGRASRGVCRPMSSSPQTPASQAWSRGSAAARLHLSSQLCCLLVPECTVQGSGHGCDGRGPGPRSATRGVRMRRGAATPTPPPDAGRGLAITVRSSRPRGPWRAPHRATGRCTSRPCGHLRGVAVGRQDAGVGPPPGARLRSRRPATTSRGSASQGPGLGAETPGPEGPLPALPRAPVLRLTVRLLGTRHHARSHGSPCEHQAGRRGPWPLLRAHLCILGKSTRRGG